MKGRTKAQFKQRIAELEGEIEQHVTEVKIRDACNARLRERIDRLVKALGEVEASRRRGVTTIFALARFLGTTSPGMSEGAARVIEEEITRAQAK